MNDNDIMIARKTETGCKTVVIDGEAADCERINRQIQHRKKAEEDTAKAEADKKEQFKRYQSHVAMAEKKRAEVEREMRRKRRILTCGLVASVSALMALTMAGLMHEVVGMVFIAGAAAAFGWHLGRAR